MENRSELPSVSVIIPFLNNPEEVIKIKERLSEQSYPQDKIELIFIDNGSTESIQFPDSFFTDTTLIREDVHKNSPYSARNRGIEHSAAEVVIFLDANSIPGKRWLEEGIRCLQTSGADLAAGKVSFDFKEQITAGKIVDSLTSIMMKTAVTERGAAYTANLFVRRVLFDEIGLFEEGVRSGGDVRWTLKAKNKGYSLVYCEKAVVKKFARSASELYQKKVRTGRGYFYTWREDEGRHVWFYNLLRSLKPPTFSKIRELNRDRYRDEYDDFIFRVWFHFYASGVVEQLAFSWEYFRNQIFKKGKEG